jgi:hypothetical protein
LFREKSVEAWAYRILSSLFRGGAFRNQHANLQAWAWGLRIIMAKTHEENIKVDFFILEDAAEPLA